jgi:hypothetical protein
MEWVMPSFKQDELRQKALDAARDLMLAGGNFASGQKERQRADKLRRDIAEKNDAMKPVFLRPNDLAGDWDGSKTLMTTLGGKLRKITDEDIAVFKRNAEVLGQRYVGGITPQQVIDFSLGIDRERANKEIFYCSPFRRKGDVQRFITNASKTSRHDRHYVDVQFMSFNALVTQPRKVGLRLTRQQLASGYIKFDCTCEHHTFRRRYVATVGKYAYGRQENAYPKMTNPHLDGVACKHVLRVMQYITSPAGVQYMQAQVDKDRNAQLGQTVKETQAQMKARLESQAEISHHKKQSIQTTEERPAYKRKMAQEFAKEQKRLQQEERMAMSRLQIREAKLKEAEKFKIIMTPDEFDTYVKGVEAKYPL